MPPTDLAQSDKTTYSTSSLTITWKAPVDTGCLDILDYKIQKFEALGGWTDATLGIGSTSGTVTGLTPGTLVILRVVARNSLGFGIESSSISLTPSKLPTPPSSLSVTAFGSDSLALSWSGTTDSGIGDSTTIALDSYVLEVDENFG